MVMETDIGRDADDLFALLYFLGIGTKFAAICVTPGDHDQVAVVKAVLRYFGQPDIPVLTPAARVQKASVTPFHQWVISQLGGKAIEQPDGHEEALPKDPVEVFICGPAKMAHLLTPTSITMQGGFVPYSRHRPAKVLEKFEGKEACATFNLGGTNKTVSQTIIDAQVDHLWVGKNVCHTVVYTPEVHEQWCPKDKGNKALELHRMAVEQYISQKGAKAFHDPLAALISRPANKDLGIWLPLKPERIKGEYTAVPVEKFHQSLAELPTDPWQRYFDGLAQTA